MRLGVQATLAARRVGGQARLQLGVLARIGRDVAFEDDRRRPAKVSAAAELGQAAEVVVALVVGEPDDLERMVPFEQAVGVVVDRLAGPGQQAGGRVLFAEDQVGVGLAALQGDPHRHLADRAAGQRIGPAQRLRAQQHVDAEGAALPHEAVQEQGRFLGDAIVLDEQLLELVDHQQDAGQLLVGLGVAEALEVLHAQPAELIAAGPQFGVQPLQDAQAELPLALDGDHPGVRQLVPRVGLELHAFLEVDEVHFDLVGTVAEGHVGDQHVQQRRLAGARLAGDEHVLRGAAAQVEVLEFHRAGAAQGHVDAAAAVAGPPGIFGGNDAVERHLDAAGVADLVAHGAHDLGEPLGRRRGVERHRRRAVLGMLPDELPLLRTQQQGPGVEVGDADVVRRR